MKLHRPAAALPLGAAAALLGACAEVEPTWVRLAAGFEPRPLMEVATGWVDGSSALRVRQHDDGESVWVEAELAREDWSPLGEDAWSAAAPTGRAWRIASAGRVHLGAEGREFQPFVPDSSPGPGSFLVEEEQVLLQLAPGEEPPATAVLGRLVSSGAEVHGSWRVRSGEELTADGIPVWTGAGETISCTIPPDSALLFTTLWTAPRGGATLRVELDGVSLLEHAAGAGEGSRFHRVPLPAGGNQRARLSFHVDGEGLGLFLAPRLAPAEVGTYRSRPWGEDRPDVVLFLADTFRADNLALHGGDPELTPRLNAFAERSVRFLEARSSASWTLPSISTILTGLHPAQHAAIDHDLTLSYDVETIAERLLARGYRTAAITDSAYFSQGFGLDQGFELFQQINFRDWDARRTLADSLAVVDQDDGRPLLLVVHTYRVHAPYRIGPEEDVTEWDALLAEGFRRLTEEGGGRGSRARLYLEFSDRLRALYLEGVRDLDVVFGLFALGLEERGLLDSGLLAFTSDHGEAFGENQDYAHGRELWDVQVHVPLLVAGAGLQPRDVRSTVSLVDLAATLATYAGVPGDWQAPSLLTAEGDRASYSYLLEDVDRRRKMSIAEGPHKVIARPDAEDLRAGEVTHAFDLEADPREERNLVDAEPLPAWVLEFCARQAGAAEDFLTPRVEAGEVGADATRDLEKLGYGGG